MRLASQIYTFLLMIIATSVAIAQLPQINLSTEINSISFTTQDIGYLIDPSKQITIDQIRNSPTILSRAKGNKIFEAIPQHVWLAFQLKVKKEDSFSNYILQFGNAHIGSYELYIFDINGLLVLKEEQGDNFPFGQRAVRHNFFVHNMPPSSGDILSLYIKINQEGQEVNMPIDIFEKNHFTEHTLNNKIFHGLILGLFMVTAIMTLILFFIYKEKYFFYEVIVSVASIFYILSEEGYGLMILWPSSPYCNSISRPLIISIVVIFSLLFTMDFLKIKDESNRFKYLAFSSIIIYILFILVAHPFNLTGIRVERTIGNIIFIFLILTALNCILIIVSAFYSWIYEKNTDGMVVFWVFIATLASMMVRILAIKGYGTSSNLLQHTGFITRGIHIPLIGGYLIYVALKTFRKTHDEKVLLLEQKNNSTKTIIENLDAERQRISMALHDSAGSIITGLKANLQMIKEDYNGIDTDQHYMSSLKMSDQLQQEIRLISNDLLPSSILKLGLVAEIKSILHRIEATYHIETSLETNTSGKRVFEDQTIFHLYYIIREALDNITKYAEAKNILVQYFEYDDEIHLLIEDDGKGFNIIEAKEKGGHGLKNMALRVAWLDGTIDVYSKNGTSVSINVPI